MNGRVGWGLMSTARINERIIPVIWASPRSDLLAVASRSRDTAERYAREWRIPRAYGAYEDMLADPDIDAVYIALPNHLHVEWAVRCADAGKHVLCEKPIALTTEEVDRMAQAAERNRVVIQEAAMMRFHPQTRYVRDLLEQGAIGEVRLVRGVFTFVLEREGDIRWDPAMGGGSLWDLGSYCVSFARAVLRAEPIEVSAMQTTSRGGVDTNLSAQMRFPGDKFVQFFSSFAAFAHVEADLLGTTGRLHLDLPWLNQLNQSANVTWARPRGDQGPSTFGDDTQSQVTSIHTYENVNAYQNEVDSMVASILDDAALTIPLPDSRRNVAAIVALLASARENRPVML
jgi:xylose dehydrogenase (NAD/NADP)